eukprot:gene19580-26263_t
MASLFVICKHPESSQLTFDVIQTLSTIEKVSIVVYGVQNVTPNKARVFYRQNVEVIKADDNKLDVDAVLAELTKRSPSDLIVIHTLNIVGAICTSLQSYFESNSNIRIHAYCEVPRDLPLRRHFDTLKEFTTNPSVASRVQVLASTTENAALLKPFVNRDVRVLPPGVFVDQYKTIPNNAAREALGIKDGEFTIVALGRIDSVVLMFAEFMSKHPGLEARLVMPIDQNIKDVVVEMYVNEFALRGLDPKDHIKKLVLLRDMGFMSSDEVNIVLNAGNVVVHANPMTDYNIYGYQCALVGVPQVIPALPSNIDNLDVSLLKLVDTNYQFYIFDEYGGKLRLSGHESLNLLLTDVFTNYAKYADKANSLRKAVKVDVNTTLSWDNWRKAFVPPTSGADYQKEIDDLKQKLSDILLAVRSK